MKLQNFAFATDLIGINYGDSYLDLHNNYDFLTHEQVGEKLRLTWHRVNGDWVSPSLPASLAIEADGVSYLEVRGELSHTLEELGFFNDDTLGQVQYNGLDHPEEACSILVLRFAGGGEIALKATSLRVEVGT